MAKDNKNYENAIELLKSIATNKRVILTSKLYNEINNVSDKN